MHGIVTETRVPPIPQFGAHKLREMCKTVERSSEEQEARVAEALVEKVIKQEPQDPNPAIFCQAGDVSACFTEELSSTQQLSSETKPGPKQSVELTQTNKNWDNISVNPESTNKRKIDAESPLDLSVKRPRCLGNNDVQNDLSIPAHFSEAKKTKSDDVSATRHSVTSNQNLLLSQLTHQEHSVATDCAETKPSSDHVFMRFKLDKGDSNVANKSKYRYGKYKSYLAAYHQKYGQADRVQSQASLNNHEPIKNSYSLSREQTQPIKKRFDAQPITSELPHASRSSSATVGTKNELKHTHLPSSVSRVQEHPRNNSRSAEFERICALVAKHGSDLSKQHQNFVSRKNEVTNRGGKARHPSPLHNKGNNSNHVSAAAKSSTIPAAKFNLGAILNLSVEQFLDHLRQATPNDTVGVFDTSPCSSTASKTVSNDDIFAGLGDWASIETGKFLAFGKPSSLKRNNVLYPPHTSDNKGLEETYFTEHWQSVHRTRMPDVSGNHATDLHCLASYDIKHRCPGCSNRAVSVPKLVSEIWRYGKSNKYTTPTSTTNANVVYCTQLQPRRHNGNSQSSVMTSSSDDVISRSKQNANRTCAAHVSNTERIPRTSNESRAHVECANNANGDVKKIDTSEKNKLHHCDDDLLANFIEYSSDEEDEPIRNEKFVKLRYLVSTKPLPTKSVFPLRRNLPKHFVESMRKDAPVYNYRFHNLVNNCSAAQDSEQDFNVDDLEISDDDDDQRSV